MRRIEIKNGLVTACLMLLFFVSCTGGKTARQGRTDAPAKGQQMADTLAEEDDYVWTEEEVKAVPDGLFEDFLLNFVTDTCLQRKRVSFPLPLVGEEGERMIAQEEWRRIQPFDGLDIYVTLYQREEEMELEKDTSLHTVAVECLSVMENRVRSFRFDRREGQWFLGGVDEQPLAQYADSEFVRFLSRFVSDSLFQCRHVSEPLPFVTIDPEDDFNILEATIDAEQWAAFAPPMPGGLLVNINYGQHIAKPSHQRVMMLKGFSSGFSCTLYFRRRAGEWMLTRYEDVSN